MGTILFLNSQTLATPFTISSLQNVVIRPYVYVASTADYLFQGTSANSIDNSGEIIGNIWLGNNDSSWANSIYNRQGASISGYVILKGDGNSIINKGSIIQASALYATVYISAVNASSSITNASGAEISGANVAIIRGASNDTAAVKLTNYGTIMGGNLAYDGKYCVASDIIYNAGVMQGDVNLGSGDDRYDGRRGTIDGTVFGGDGVDIFLPGAGAEAFDGGAGSDRVDFSSAAGAVQVYLDGSGLNAGLAAGDVYTAVETFVGTALADILVGDVGANYFVGGGGADTLDGRAGSDALTGGFGADALTGGAGSDSFVYNSAAEGAATEIISDLTNRTGENDMIRVSASGFGGGLTAGLYLTAAQFVAYSGAFTDTANLRFYFDTSTNLLSYDADGSGAEYARTPIAKVFGTGGFTNADIFVMG